MIIAKAAVTIYPTWQITYADGYTGPRQVQVPARPPQTLPNRPGLRKRHGRRKTAPGTWNRRQPQGHGKVVK